MFLLLTTLESVHRAGVAESFRRQPAELLYMGSIPIPSFSIFFGSYILSFFVIDFSADKKQNF
jgi:hypothetical protein